MPASSHVLDRIDVTFDDEPCGRQRRADLAGHAAGSSRLEAAADALVSTGYRPGRKVATVVFGILAGADCIDDLAVLRAGATERVLPFKPMAPSTVGTWLRTQTFGHVRQFDKLTETMLTRAWAAGAGPGAAPMTIDVDSSAPRGAV